MKPRSSPLALPLMLLAAGCGGEGGGKTTPPAGGDPAPPPAQVAAPPGPIVKGASFSARIEAQAAKAGAPSTAVVTVEPIAGYKVNEEYPYKCKLDDPPSAGVSYPTPVVTDVERTKQLATMKLPFVAATPGTVRVGGTCSLSVCTEENCVIEKVALATDVKVD